MAAYATLVSLMHIINNLELHPRPPISLDKNQVDRLSQNIIFLQNFLEGYNPSLDYSTEADPLESRIVDAAQAAEDVIESHIVDQIIGPATVNLDQITFKSGRQKFISSTDALYDALEKLIQEMALIQKEAMEIERHTVGVQFQRKLHSKSTSLDSLGSSSSSSSSSAVAQQNKMVGVDELLLEMKDKLKSDRLALQIIPIVGMGGSGKTTLARNIYQDPLIKEHFHIRAWVTISQEFSIAEILVQLLKQLDKVASQDSSEGELGDMLYKHLFGRRYLIILDDMWNIGAWEGIGMFLPNRVNGSRIVVTTRLTNLASNLPNPQRLEMKLLNEDDSWDLLSITVFGKKSCPLELEELGKKISKNCKGLPLSIVVVGGLLSKSEHTIEFWKYIEENLRSIVHLEDDERCLKTLHMSYKQLPVYLKPCFLYMGVYLEDEEIRVSNLIKLWVAEGFIKPVNGKSLEETAKEYLNDLNSRNLIFIHKLGSIGKMKYCKIHDSLRDLSLREAQKERFYRPTALGILNGQRRIVVSSEEALNALPSSMPLARSFLWHMHLKAAPPLDFRLLRIMQSDSNREQKSNILESIHQLVNLRFFKFAGEDERKFSDSIWLFWNLETFIFDRLYDKTKVPSNIWYIPHIRCVRISRLFLSDPPKDASVLGNLQTLGDICDFKLSEQMVKMIPNIKKLVISYPNEYKGCLNNLVCLDKLESLRVTIGFYEGLVNFPYSLKKLTINSSYMEITFNEIGQLPLVEKLVLDVVKFEQGHWETIEGQFRRLKFLHIIGCRTLEFWTSESSHFPRLEHLALSRLPYLQEIPLDFADIATLRVIEVKECTDSVVVSAKKITEEREEIYGEEENLQVEVTMVWKDQALLSLATPNFRVTSLYNKGRFGSIFG